jgi:hypothetical protein
MYSDILGTALYYCRKLAAPLRFIPALTPNVSFATPRTHFCGSEPSGSGRGSENRWKRP